MAKLRKLEKAEIPNALKVSQPELVRTRLGGRDERLHERANEVNKLFQNTIAFSPRLL